MTFNSPAGTHGDGSEGKEKMDVGGGKAGFAAGRAEEGSGPGDGMVMMMMLMRRGYSDSCTRSP